MAKVTWKDEDYELSLSCALYKLQQSNVLCDVVIVTKSGTIPVHRLIFYAFHATVYSDSNSQSGVGSTADSLFSKFYEFDSGIVTTLIRYLYTGEVTLDQTDVQEFCRLCKVIGLKKVAIAVEKIKEQGQRSRLSDKSQSHDNTTNTVCDNGHEKSQQHKSSNITKSLEETLMERNSTIMTEIKKEPADLDLSDTEMSNDFEPNHANNDHEHDEEDQDKTLDDSDSVGNHDKTGVIKLSMCGQCSQIFKDREEFVRHMEIKHQLFVCTQCDFQERQKEKLDKHFQDVHANNKTEATEERTMQVKKVHRPANPRGKLRVYDSSQLTKAYDAAKNRGYSIRKAAKEYGVPYATLRDRISGNVNPDCMKMGREPELNQEQEAKLVSHLDRMTLLGYRYTRKEVVDLASEYASHLQIRAQCDPFSLRWFYLFLKRWPHLKLLKPARGKGSIDKESVDKYFEELANVIDKYDLKNKPHLIYSVNEKDVAPEHETPVASPGKSETVTLLGCGSASGSAIPPYFVCQGKIWQKRWAEGFTPGANGTISNTGLTTSQVFIDYLKNHFLSFVPGNYEKLLLLVDGEKSHVSIPVLDWAQDHNLIIQVLPAYTSEFLHPMDVGVYGQFQTIYDNLCLMKNSTSVQKGDICQMACSAYVKSCTPENLQSSFKKTGIFPLNRKVIQIEHFVVAERSSVVVNDVMDVDSDDEVGDKVIYLAEPLKENLVS